MVHYINTEHGVVFEKFGIRPNGNT